MKVTLDLDRLLAEGRITREEHDRFSGFASHSTKHVVFNILIGFGVVAVAGSLLVLFPFPTASIVLGLGIGAAGFWLVHQASTQWLVLANICLVVGALLVGGGLVVADEGSLSAFLATTLIFAVAAVFARSSFLVALSVLALAATLGARTGYMHATYFLGVEEPALTAVVFTVLGLATYQLALRLEGEWQSLAISASRTSVFLVNLALWVGSLWGDELGQSGAGGIPPQIFSIVWALAIVGAMAWAAHRNRRWLVNVAAVFGSIHFYTQWFATLGASPFSVLAAGLIALGIAVVLSRMNMRWAKAGPA